MALDIGNKNDTEISDEGQKEIFRQKTIYGVGGIPIFLGFLYIQKLINYLEKRDKLKLVSINNLS